MQKNKKIILFAISIFLILNFSFSANATTDYSKCFENKSILILNSTYSSSYEESLTSSIILYIKELFPNSKVKSENLKNDNNKSTMTNLEFILNKHSNYDLVICLDKESTELVSKIKYMYLKDTPILFCFPDDAPPDVEDGFGGYYVPYNFNVFLANLLSIHPTTQEVNILINRGFESTYFYKKIENVVEYYKFVDSKIKFNIITSSFKESKLEMFDDKNALNILYTHSYKEASPDLFVEYTGYGTEKYIATITKNPTYGGFAEFITGYNIGGYNYDGFLLGRMLVKDAVSLFNEGKDISDIGINEYNIDNYLKINSALINKYDIPKNLENTLYQTVNLGETTLDKDRNFLIALVITILLVITITLIGLNFYVKKLYLERVNIDKMKNNFIANVSHELRTPLNIIISCIQLLKVQKEKGEISSKNNDFDQKFLYLQKNSSRLLRIVNNIIDITKIDAGFFNIDKTKNDIINIVEDITLSSVPYAECKSITLIFDTNVEELSFSFDKERLERVILNLLSNALKFTPENGDILVVVEKKDKCVLIKIKDSGIGIDNTKINKIFDRFVQAEDSLYRKSEGSGIGLSICKALVELHSGVIRVESELGKGSTFIVELPLISDTDKRLSNKIEDGISKQVNIEYSDFNNYF